MSPEVFRQGSASPPGAVPGTGQRLDGTSYKQHLAGIEFRQKSLVTLICGKILKALSPGKRSNRSAISSGERGEGESANVECRPSSESGRSG